MTSITEKEFKSLLLPQLRQDPLIDRAVLFITHSYNNFSKNLILGFRTGCLSNSYSLARIFINKGLNIYTDDLYLLLPGGNVIKRYNKTRHC